MLVIGKNSYGSNLDLCLTSRALGASEIIFVDKKDDKIVRHMNNLRSRWGGRFRVTFASNYKEVLKRTNKYKRVYLTRYGIPLNKLNYTIKTYKNIMLIITVKETFAPIHKLSDFNVCITDQPHCGAAAIAVFLHNFFGGRELAVHFENAKYRVIPKEHGIDIERIRRR